jgi:inward rectifier potassium channel
MSNENNDELVGLETQYFRSASVISQLNISEQIKDKDDVGFGEQVLKRSKRRMINRNGTFNVRKRGYSLFRSKSLYHKALALSWPSFFLAISVTYLLINLSFAFIYMLLPLDAFNGMPDGNFLDKFYNSFFFSVQTLATIGYGFISPRSITANIIVTAESIIAVFIYALCSGLVFARYSRPTAKILYSHKALIAPYKDTTAFMFRVINERQNQILNLEAKVMLSLNEYENGIRKRKFYELPLERTRVLFFPLNWTIVHAIDKESPLYGKSEHALHEGDAEFLILLTGLDDGFSQVVTSYNSYKPQEIVWGAKFSDLLEEENGIVHVDLNKIHDYHPAVLPRDTLT